MDNLTRQLFNIYLDAGFAAHCTRRLGANCATQCVDSAFAPLSVEKTSGGWYGICFARE